LGNKFGTGEEIDNDPDEDKNQKGEQEDDDQVTDAGDLRNTGSLDRSLCLFSSGMGLDTPKTKARISREMIRNTINEAPPLNKIVRLKNGRF
jgi:hypothetical protein